MKKPYLIILFVVLALFSACQTTGPNAEEEDAIKAALKEGDTKSAIASLEASVESYNDQAVYDLDSGMLYFYDGDYKTAIGLLSSAEEQIENNRVASVSEGVGGLLVNDNVRAYSGANYEDLYIKGIKALSYYGLGEYDEAAVEIRRANIIARDYALNPEEQSSMLEDLVFALTPNPFVEGHGVPEVQDYTESAFITYLSMLMYRGMGDIDNASIDYNALSGNEAVTVEDIEIPSGMARVNFIALDGLIATKKGASVLATSIAPVEGGFITHLVSWPEIPAFEGSSVREVIITSSDGQTVSLGVLEDVSDAARDNLMMDYKSNYLRSYYRGYTKMLAAVTAAQVTYNEAVDALKDQNPLAKKAGEVAAKTAFDAALAVVDSSEIPDTRMGRFLPDTVMAGGMTLVPGTYDFTVTFRTARGDVSVPFTGVEVSATKPNVIFASCAR